MSRVIVIGGGITGLAAAHRICELDSSVDVLVLEAAEQPGGLLRTERLDGYVIERGPDAILTEKPAGLALIRRLGLADQLVSTNSNHRGAYVVRDGELVRIPEGFSIIGPGSLRSLFKTPVLSPVGKARAALDLVLPRGRSRSEESLASFVRRRFGNEVLERLAQPLAGGIYGADPERLSLTATMPRFIELERNHRSVYRGLARKARQAAQQSTGARYGLFVSFQRGMQTLVDALHEKLGDRVRTQSPVRALRGEGRVELLNGETLDADTVILAVPAPHAADVLRDLDGELAKSLDALEYGSVATITGAFDTSSITRPLDAFGFVVPAIEQRAIMASTWLSVKWPGRAPPGKALVRFFVSDEHIMNQDDESLIATVLREARDRMAIHGVPELTRVDRFYRVMPRYYVGYLEWRDRIRQQSRRHVWLQLAGNAYDGVGIPDAIHSGEQAADRVIAGLRK